MKHLVDKTVLVTGASRGIGEAAARHFVACEANVVLLSRSSDKINEIAAELGSRAVAVSGDVADYQSMSKAVETAKQTFGALDVLVNNAGVIEPIARLEDSDPHSWSKASDINLKGVYYGMHAAYPELLKTSGVIVNVSSGAASSALEGWSHYCAGKAGALALTRCAHLEWASKGIRVVGLSPGTVATEMQVSIKASGINPVSEIDWSDHISAESVAKAIAWLTQESASAHDGTDFSLRSDEGRMAAGLSS